MHRPLPPQVHKIQGDAHPYLRWLSIHLFHQVVVPVTPDDHMCRGPQIDGLDQVEIRDYADAKKVRAVHGGPC